MRPSWLARAQALDVALALGGALLGALAVILVVRWDPNAPAAREDTVVLYGDSLAFQSAGSFTTALAAESRAEVVVRAVPGSAICDHKEQIRADLAELRPAVVLLEFAGNNSTDCTGHLVGTELATRYAADAAELTNLFVGQDTRVVWVGPPPILGLPSQASAEIDRGYRALADMWSGRVPDIVTYAPAGESVSGPGGAYVPTLPCLPDEGPDDGCQNGHIPVRHADQIHFCPTPKEDASCAVYSSGSRRYGQAMARAVLDRLPARAKVQS